MELKYIKLEDLTINGKGHYGIVASAVPFSEELYTYLRITDINDDGTLNVQDLKSVDSPDAKDYILRENDIVFARTGASTGRNYFYNSKDGIFVYAGFLIKFSINPIKVNPKYIKYYCLSENYKNWIYSFNTGSTRGNINAQTLASLVIPIPPRNQQNFLVDILSSIDDKIELNNKINENLEQQAQAIFKNWFVDNKIQNGTIGDYCDIKSGYAFKGAWWQDEGIKVIRIGDIEQDNLNLTNCNKVSNDKIKIAKDFLVKGGDFVIAMTGATIGKFAIVPEYDEPILVNQRVGKFFLGENPLERIPFIYCTMKLPEVIGEFINRGQGSAQPNISTTDIKTIPCYMPSQDEVNKFNEKFSPLFEKVVLNQKENQYLINLRDRLLPKLMSGEIDVSKLEI